MGLNCHHKLFRRDRQPGRRGDRSPVLRHRHNVVVANDVVHLHAVDLMRADVLPARRDRLGPPTRQIVKSETTCGQRLLSFEQLLLRHSRERLGQSSQPRVQLRP